MRDAPFDFKEFEDEVTLDVEEEGMVYHDGEEVAEEETSELDVQKAVVEELAAEKLALHEKVINKVAEYQALQSKYLELDKKMQEKEAVLQAQKNEIAKLKAEIESFQERNPNALALLDREVELPDRFPGETRDHVLEVLKAARDQAEAEGRLRRAQVLEGVLVANEPSGQLAERRAALEKLFNENANVVNGTVLAELEKLGISHKKGEEYLLPSEILLRSY